MLRSLFFRTNEQRVGRFEAFGGESLVFHKFSWVDGEPLCKARATRIILSYNTLTLSIL